MPLIPRIANLWRNLTHKNQVEQECEEELQACLEMLIDARINQGLAPEEARRNALIELGGIEQVKQSVREVRMGYLLETIWQDIRYGLRMLFKSPIFTAVAIISLALGIGANTAIFSVVNGILLRPLPYPDPEKLVVVWHTPPEDSFPGMKTFSVSPANYLDWKDQSKSFEQLAAIGYAGLSLRSNEHTEALTGAAVSSDFFSVLRSNAFLGRTFLAEEDQPGKDQAVVLGHGLWQRAFGGNPNLIGQTVTLNSRSFTVVGVMPAGFKFPAEVDLWVPLGWTDEDRQTRSMHDYEVIARLKPNVTLTQAQAEMTTISKRLEQQYTEDNRGWGAVVIPLQEELVGDIRPALLVLFSAVGFVLLIACANVANLMLAKGANRQKEIAVRIALGASRARVARQLLTESALLGLVGGLFGFLLAGWGTQILVQLSSGTITLPGEVAIDKWAFGFTLLVSLMAGIVAGIAPALQFRKTDMSEPLKQGTGRTGGDSVKQRTRKALVICEVAMSLILLIGAGLMIRSFWKLQQVDPGFDIGNTLTMSVELLSAKYSEPSQQIAFFDRALEEIRTLPGVDSVGSTTTLPLRGGGSTQPFTIEGRPAASLAEQPTAKVRYVSPDYFRAMGIPVQQGRVFSDQDRQDAAQVAVVSESMAGRFFSGQDPVGKRLTPSFHLKDGQRQIVGVVGDVKGNLDDPPLPTIYLPYKQLPRPWVTLVVRTAADPNSLIQPVSRAINGIDKDLALRDVGTMDQVLAESLSGRRFNMILLIAFAGLALLLAAVGVYGVINYSVTLRKREMGLRMALGARATNVLQMILREGLMLIISGVAVGLIGALALTHLMASLLYGVTATDPVTFAGVSVVLISIGLLASYLPARRATKVDPMIALRDE